MMKNLFLCSSFADVATFLPTFAGVSLKGKIVAFIPTASIHEDYTQYIDDGREALESLGLVVRPLEISSCAPDETVRTINECDLIYVSGGNTFFLMQELRRTGVGRLLVDQIKKGKIYIGESAGAMIVAPDIEYAKEMDDCQSQTPGFADFASLGIVDFYPVVHFGCFPFEEVTCQMVQKFAHLPLMPISNTQVIVVTDDSVAVYGEP